MVNKEIEEFAAKIAQQQDAGMRIKKQRLENQQLKEELERYRERDRLQEAGQVPLTEQQKLINEIKPIMKEEETIPNLGEIIDSQGVDMIEAVKIQQAMRLKKDSLKAACITAELRKDRDKPQINWEGKYNKEHKLRQEAETETILVKGIGMNSPEMKDAKKTIAELRATTERFGRENNDLYNRIADALEVNESHQKMNGKLQERLTELEEENKKIHARLDERIDSMRKSGM